MNCHKATQQIPLFIEADLETAEMQQVSLHLEACHACREIAAEFQSSQSSFRAVTAPVFDEAILVEMRAAVQYAIAQTTTRPPFVEWLPSVWTWKVAFAASIALLLLSGIVMYRREGEEQHQPHVTANRQVKAVPSASPVLKEDLAKSFLGNRRVLQPRMGRNNPALGEVRASEHNPGTNAIKYPSPERTTESDDQMIAASLAPAGVDTFPPTNSGGDGFILPLAPAAENAAEAPNLKLVSPEPEMLRMEFQTADPNIKIIWLTPKEPARTTPAANIQ
jgi:hypothetical protein